MSLLSDNTVALLPGMAERKTNRIWVEALDYAYEMSNQRVTTCVNKGGTP